MVEKHVVFALIERRARLAGELRATQAEVRRMKKALASVDLCIRMFKTDYEPQSIAPKVTLDKNPAGLPQGQREPQGARHTPGDRGAPYGAGTRPVDPGAHGKAAE